MGNNRNVMRGAVSGAVLGAASVIVFATACTQTNSGKPSTSRLSGSSASPSRSGSPVPSSASVPTALPTLGGGTGADSAICRDFRDAGGQLNKFGRHDRYAVELWRKLAADAPAAIRPETQLVAKFVADASAGHAVLSSVPKAMTALGKVADWASRNCI